MAAIAAPPPPARAPVRDAPGSTAPGALRPPATALSAPAPAPTLAPVRARSHRRWWVIALVALVAAGATFQWWRTTHATPAVRYVTSTVGRGAVTRTITASGSVNPETTVQVGTYVSGVIQALYCDYNTRVRKGQLCAKIDPRPYQTIVEQDSANLSTAKAQLAKDQTGLTYAKLTLDRAIELRSRGIVSQDQLDSAKSSYDQAAAQLDLDKSAIAQHQAALRAAELNVAYTNIVSPVDGTVVSRAVTMGQTVAASFQTPTLFLIATDLTKMQVDANVSESDIGGIADGTVATFTVEAFPTRVFQGRVTQVRQAPQTVQNVVTYDAVISVPNPELLLKPGMTATVRIVQDRRDDVLRVPDPALRYIPGGVASVATTRGRPNGSARVWVLRDGRPTEVPVGVGLDDDSYTEIVSGELRAGDQVVTAEQAASSGLAQPRLAPVR